MAMCYDQVLAQSSDKIMTFDQTIQIISNLSDVSSQRNEDRSVKELLAQNIGGFRFHLLWDHKNSLLLYKLPDGQLKNFEMVIDQVNDHLEENPEKVLTFFLDLDLPIDTLKMVFQEKGLIKYLHKQPIDET